MFRHSVIALFVFYLGTVSAAPIAKREVPQGKSVID
jgi:hypothetical protein